MDSAPTRRRAAAGLAYDPLEDFDTIGLIADVQMTIARDREAQRTRLEEQVDLWRQVIEDADITAS